MPDADRCVCCGEIVPEGRQICPQCERKRYIYTIPNIQDMLVKHDYRDVKIDTNTIVTIDLEDIKKRIKDDIYKNLTAGRL